MKTFICGGCGQETQQKAVTQKWCCRCSRSAGVRKYKTVKIRKDCVSCGNSFEIPEKSKQEYCSSDCIRRLKNTRSNMKWIIKEPQVYRPTKTDTWGLFQGCPL